MSHLSNHIHSKNELEKSIYFINMICFLVAFWTMIGIPYKIAVVVNILILILPILFARKHCDEIKLYPLLPQNESGLSAAMMIPPFTLLLKAILSFHLVLSIKFWIIGTITSIILYIIFLILLNKTMYLEGMIGMLLTVIPLAFGSIIHVNCLFDYSDGVAYQTKVQSRYISSSYRGLTLFYLNVSPWGPYDKETKISVPKAIYNQSADGESISITLKEGCLGIQYYYFN